MKDSRQHNLTKILFIAYTLILVCIGWIIFLATDLNVIKEILLSICGFNGVGNISAIINTQVLTLRYMLPLVLGIIFSMPLYQKLSLKLDKKPLLRDLMLIGLFLLSTWIILVDSYNPFIYFRF